MIAYTILFYDFTGNKVIGLNIKNVECVIVDRNAPQSLFDYLKKEKIDYIKSGYIKNTLEAVSTHPDMQICHIGANRYVCEPSLYEYYCNELRKYDVKLFKGNKYISDTYPEDISYNVVVTENIILHNLKYTDKMILNEVESSAISIYKVKQGYTKCATCIIDDNALITSDESIYKVCVANNIDCLLIEKGFIKLDDKHDGFIGGCCGFVGSEKLLFCGDITSHPSYNKIVEFASKYSVEIIPSSNDILSDIGSIIPVVKK